MKILKGAYKGIELAVPQDGSVRPTVDHFKKHILRLSQEADVHCLWDLFAGCGGVALEFLSQGTREAVFVEQSTKATSCLRLNLAECNLKDPKNFSKHEVHVVQAPVENFLKNPQEYNVTKSPDLIFLDPPYGQNHMKKIIPLLLKCPLILSDALFIVEHVVEEPVDVEENPLKIILQEVYGPKALTCFRKP